MTAEDGKPMTEGEQEWTIFTMPEKDTSGTERAEANQGNGTVNRSVEISNDVIITIVTFYMLQVLQQFGRERWTVARERVCWTYCLSMYPLDTIRAHTSG